MDQVYNTIYVDVFIFVILMCLYLLYSMLFYNLQRILHSNSIVQNRTKGKDKHSVHFFIQKWEFSHS